jgi:hypothetical protein
MEVALKFHTYLIIFYAVWLILLVFFTILHLSAQHLAEAWTWVYREMDPEQKKQILEALGGYKHLPETDPQPSKQVLETLDGQQKFPDQSKSGPTVYSPLESGINNQPIPQERIVNQARNGPPITGSQFFEDKIAAHIRNAGVEFVTNNMNPDNRQVVNNFIDLAPQAGLTPDHLGIADPTSVENKGHAIVQVPILDPVTGQVNTEPFTCFNPDKCYESFKQAREAGGVPVPLMEKAITNLGLLFTAGSETMCYPNVGTSIHNELTGIESTLPDPVTQSGPDPVTQSGPDPVTPTDPNNPFFNF